MQNLDDINHCQRPVPPPPPPPEKISQNCKCKYASYKDYKQVKRSAEEDVVSAVRHLTPNFFVEDPSNLISFYCPVSPVIQEGRCCGIVALSMASQLIHPVSVEDILNCAKSSNFTKEGEMFSAYNMATLAKSLLDCESYVLSDLNVHKEDLLSHICKGWPVLVPYDADRNHFPCTNNGITAHWAVITGLCFTVSDKSALNAAKNYEVIKKYPEVNIFVVKDGPFCHKLLNHAEKIFLYAHQGKSRHLAAWDINDLLESNKNMYEVTKKYSPDQLVLPSGDCLSELRNKAVLLKKKN